MTLYVEKALTETPTYRFNPATGKVINVGDPEPTIAERRIGLGNARMPHYIIDTVHAGNLTNLSPIELVALGHLYVDRDTATVLGLVDEELHPYSTYYNIVMTARDRMASSSTKLPPKIWQLLIHFGTAGQRAMVSRNQNCPEEIRNMAALAVSAPRN
jgi:hypothetical protein